INGILQKVATNNKISKQATSKLAILLESPDLPQVVAEMATHFTQQKKLRSLLGDMKNSQQHHQNILENNQLVVIKM
ncbi:hypothetical protein VP01_14166g1, partial [Puccinia sorghi]